VHCTGGSKSDTRLYTVVLTEWLLSETTSVRDDDGMEAVCGGVPLAGHEGRIRNGGAGGLIGDGDLINRHVHIWVDWTNALL
jgi:hypothetical protein